MTDEDFDAKDVGAEHLSVDCRKKVRDKLQQEIEAFLASGGQIEHVDRRTSGDPPQKPNSGYSGRSI